MRSTKQDVPRAFLEREPIALDVAPPVVTRSGDRPDGAAAPQPARQVVGIPGCLREAASTSAASSVTPWLTRGM